MKKTIRININGLIFNLDEDAYDKLQKYLGSITNKFLNTEDGNEVIADVEARVAELFTEKVGDRKEVINMEDIDYIIEIMGQPEDFDEVIDEEYAENQDSTYKNKASKRVYRNPDDKVLSGLASGIASYFNIDPIVVRAIFVLATLFYGTSILIYILLWIIIPEATTTSQKLEMRGEDVNLSNIEKSIKEEFTNVKSRFNNWQQNRNFSSISENLSSVLQLFVKIATVILKVILIIIGINLFVASIAVLGGFTGVFFFNNTFISPFAWNNIGFSFFEFATMFTSPFAATIGLISVYLFAVIPALWIIYISLKLIFRFKVRTKAIGIISTALWVVSIVLMFAVGSRTAYNFRADAETSNKYDIETNSDTLFLEVPNFENFYKRNKADFGRVYVDLENDLKLIGKPKLHIEKSENNKIYLEIVKTTNGMSKDKANNYLKNVSYNWQQNDSILKFESRFNISGERKVRDQRVDIYLKIPVGKIIYLNENTENIIKNIQNIQHVYDRNMVGKYWIMTKNGFSLLNEELEEKTEEIHITGDSVVVNFPDKDLRLVADSIVLNVPKKNIKEEKEIKEMKEELEQM